MGSILLFEVFVFLAAACIVVPLANRFRLGSILGYLAAGVVIGPYGFAFIENAEEVMRFAEFGVVMMLFVIGLELEPKMLWRMRQAILGLGGLQVLLTTLALTAVGVTLGFAWRESLAVSMALSLSSTALVLQMLQEKNLMQTPVGEKSIAVLLFQDIAVIPILILIPMLAVVNVSTEAATATADVHGSHFLASLPNWLHGAVVVVVILVVAFARQANGELERILQSDSKGD